MSARVEFWFDFASSYSYVASQRIASLARGLGVEVEWRPFLLGPIFSAQLGIKDSPFNVQPVRGRYMWRDLERLCAKHRIPYRRPSVFPRLSVLAGRVGCAVTDAPYGANVMERIFRANFAEDRDIASPDELRAILEEAGAPAEEVLARAVSQPIKDALRSATDAASALGIFGAPNFVVGDELFFGQDRLDDALAWALKESA